MKVALVASSSLPEPGRLERRVDRLARGLAQRGAEVEVLTQAPGPGSVVHHDGVITRTFSSVAGPLRFAVAPGLRERLRLTAREFDVIDVHTRQAPLALAVASARLRRFVLTPCASADALLAWPRTRATRAMLATTPRIVCRSVIERDLLRGCIPEAARRMAIVPDGIDAEAIRSAEPLTMPGNVALAVDRLDRGTGVGRAIAAMASLDADFRLVVVGAGPARERLEAFADDLQVSSRVQFTGSIPDAELHRWLRTARVVVSLSAERSSGTAVTEACAAGVSVVASDLPIHRHAAERVGGGVIFVAPRGSPLDVADAIAEGSQLAVIPSPDLLTSPAASWDATVNASLEVYEEVLDASPLSERDEGARHLVAQSPRGAVGRVAAPIPFGHVQGGAGATSWWPTRDRTTQRADGARRWR
jgi:glycosyltransferase involved in cell wall biosynthesis